MCFHVLSQAAASVAALSCERESTLRLKGLERFTCAGLSPDSLRCLITLPESTCQFAGWCACANRGRELKRELPRMSNLKFNGMKKWIFGRKRKRKRKRKKTTVLNRKQKKILIRFSKWTHCKGEALNIVLFFFFPLSRWNSTEKKKKKKSEK